MVFKFLNVETLYGWSKQVKEITNIPLNSVLIGWGTEFNNLKASVSSSAQDFDDLYQKIDTVTGNSRLSDSLKEIQLQGKDATASINGMYQALIGETKGFGNVNRLIEQYNNITDTTGKEQKIFAEQIGASNSNLGKYLGGLNGAKAGMAGYAGQLGLATLKTIGLQAATAALSMGVSLLISEGFQFLMSWINAQAEAIKVAKEAAQETNNQIKSLQELQKEYENIIDSTDSYTEKNEALSKWKDTLIEKYDLEKDALKNVNLERQTGIDLINEEIKKQRDLWLGTNATQVKEAQNKIQSSSYSEFSIQNASVETKSLEKNIREEILSIFDSATQEWDIGNSFLNYDEQISLSFDTTNVYDTLEKINSVIAKIGDIGYDNLNYQEKELLKSLNTHKEKLDNIVEDYGEIYSTYNQYTSANILSDYVKSSGNSLDKVTEETFGAWRDGLLSLAGESEPIKAALTSLIEETFPQFTTELSDANTSITNAKSSINNLVTALGTLRETFDDTLGGQSTIQSAFDKIIAGTSLTNDEVLKLIDICPELSGALTKTADGWTTDVDNIISANESVVKSMRETIEEQIKLREASSRKSKDNIDSLTIARNKVPTEGVAHFTAQIEAENLAISENEKEISTLNILLDMLGLSLSEDSSILTEIKANIEELGKSTNTLITEAKSVSEVFAEQSENGELSAESVMKIVESGYAAALMYDKETGAIKLNAEAYQMLAEAKIAEQKVTIESDKAEAIVKRAELEAKAIGYLGASYIMTAGAADAYNQVREEMSDVDEQIAGYDAYMSLLDNLMSKFADITNGTYGATGSSTDKIKEAFDKAKKELDHLLKMNLITQKDYYARLDALNEQYYANSEKHSDEYQSNLEEIYSGINELQKKYLDEQIDAINEKADAEDKALSLKEKELEVEEKLAALNRAKKDKIRIFNGQSGVFDWGVDAEKLASAQSEYDKAVADLKDYKADEQRSEIITLIEEIRDNIGIEGSNPLSSGYTPISTEDLIKRFGGNYKGDLSSILSNVSSKTTTPNINGLAGTIANGVVTNNSSNSSNNVSIVLNGVDLSNSTEVKNAVYEALIDVFADPKVK